MYVQENIFENMRHSTRDDLMKKYIYIFQKQHFSKTIRSLNFGHRTGLHERKAFVFDVESRSDEWGFKLVWNNLNARYFLCFFYFKRLKNSWEVVESMPNHLPLATGPFVPGIVDVILDYKKEEPFFRLYYPIKERLNISAQSSKWINWLPDDAYLTGLSRVLMLNKIILKIAFWWAASMKIPAVYGAAPKTDGPPLKCIVMSHGLGGSRFLYSNICCELASRGFVVATLEHKDHSACHTFYYANKDEAEINKKSIKEFRHIKFGKDHYPRRNEQLRTRSDECGKVLDFFINLNKGLIPYNVMDDVPFHRNSPTDFSFSQLVGKLDIENICIMGHSFGAATALYTLSRRPELKCGILLDPWMFPVKGEQLEENINQPMLFINTQTFHIAANVEAMSKLMTIPNTEMYTIKHTTHENQTDSVLLVGYWLNWFMRKLNPLLALKINNSLILRFLSQRVDPLVDISDCTTLLEKERHNIEMGLTKPWA